MLKDFFYDVAVFSGMFVVVLAFADMILWLVGMVFG